MKKLGHKKKSALFAFACVLPWLIGFLAFSFKPLLDTVIYSFCSTAFTANGTIKLTFCGLESYQYILFRWNDLWEALFDYLFQICLMTPIIVAFALLIAILLNAELPCRGVFRVVFFLPVVLMQGALMDIVSDLDGMSIAGVDSMFVFSFIRQSLPEVVSSPIMYIVRNFIPIIWYSGVQILICLAGLQKQDRNMFEAASIDGASAWQVFWKITLPLSRPFILLSALYTVLDLSTADSNPVIALIKENMYTKSSGFGFPAAIACIYFLVVLLIAGLAALLLTERKKVKRR